MRLGYYVGAPYLTVDPNTKQMSGIFYEVMESVGKKLNLRMEWAEEVGFGEMAEGLRTRRFDAVASGIWQNAARGASADFTIPVLYDVVFPYVRDDDHRFDDDPTAIGAPSTRIATIDGEMAALIATTDFPKAGLLPLPQSTDFTVMIQNVVDRKADITFLGLAAARKYQAANPSKIRNLDPQHPVRVFPTAIMLPLHQETLRRALDITITEMLNNREVDAIITSNEALPGSHYRVAPPFAAPLPLPAR